MKLTDTDIQNIAETHDLKVGTVKENYLVAEEDDGGIVIDQSGGGHTGTVTGASWTSDGVMGGAFDFDGTADWISVDRSDGAFDFDETSEFTVSLWAKSAGGLVGRLIDSHISRLLCSNITDSFEARC